MMTRVPAAARVDPPDTGESQIYYQLIPSYLQVPYTNVLAEGIESWSECIQERRRYGRKTKDDSVLR
jgi:hypothetical protein